MVSTSLFTGLSGLQAHQRFMDVIGNNLANVNTPGFWGSRVAFADLLNFTLTPGQGPTANAGGRNPMQLGLGTQVASIDANTNQGTFLNTGRPLDVALKGKGFFTVTDGQRDLFTRVGSFGVDQGRQLIDLRTGLHVVSTTGSTIEVPITGTQPARATSLVKFEGTLPAKVSGPLAEVLSSVSAFLEGTAATKSNSPALTFPLDLSSHDGDTFTVSANGAAPQTVTINATNFGPLNAVTAAALVSGIQSQLTGVKVSEAGGVLTLATEKVGKAATIKLDNRRGTPLNTLGFDTILNQGTEQAASATTDLNQLTVNGPDYGAGDTIAISGTDPRGNKVAGTFTYGAANDGTTVQDLLTFLNGLYLSTDAANGATATIGTDGTLALTANAQGDAKLSLFIADQTTPAKTTWTSFKVTRDGTGPDQVVTSIDVYDTLGRSHPVTMTYTRSDSDPAVWNLAADMDGDEGTIPDAAVSGIRFNPDGSFSVVTDSNSSLEFLFDGLGTPQVVTLDFGQSSTFTGLSMLGDKATAAATDQDGYTAGTLLNVGFNEAGMLQGYFSNGQTEDLAQLRIVMFPNPSGMLRIGDTIFAQSPNSDSPVLTTAGSAGAGVVVSGVLENSNVDLAEEFVRLIEAQRGFQANARVITTTDAMLSELLNIVR